MSSFTLPQSRKAFREPHQQRGGAAVYLLDGMLSRGFVECRVGSSIRSRAE